MKSIVVTAGLMIMLTITGFAQSRLDSVKIRTSAQCEMCKERIEEALSFEQGIKSAELDLGTKIVTVYYKSSKTDPEKIRKAILKTGYDADDLEADRKAYKKLPACCKKPDDRVTF